MAASIAQEFYKVREEWEKIDKVQSWKLAIWQAEYPDVDFIDKFMEVERSPIGVFNDIFFRFESVYPGDNEDFAKSLWHEYIGWFEPTVKPEHDIMLALKEAELLTKEYIPNLNSEPSIQNLWKEILLLRSSIKNFEDYFVLYFPIVAYNPFDISAWFQEILPTVPKGIRLATMDFAQDKKLSIKDNQKTPSIAYLKPKLNTAEAVKNEMKKGGLNNNTVDLDARYRKQIIHLMDTTTIPKNPNTEHEAKRLIQIGNEINIPSAIIGSYMIAGQALYSVSSYQKSNKYIDNAIQLSADQMKQNSEYYHNWKVCMMIKASIKTVEKEYKGAIEIYDELADQAAEMQDVYYVMEARRYAASILYEKNKLNTAFEYLLLALLAGSYLDITLRRKSVFLHVAYLALYIGESVRNKDDMELLKLHLSEWLGEDWEDLLQQEGVSSITIKSKKKFINF